MIKMSTNINKTNDHVSPQIIEHIKIQTFVIEKPGSGLGQAEKSGVFKTS